MQIDEGGIRGGGSRMATIRQWTSSPHALGAVGTALGPWVSGFRAEAPVIREVDRALVGSA